jgi:hypothetical protein
LRRKNGRQSAASGKILVASRLPVQPCPPYIIFESQTYLMLNYTVMRVSAALLALAISSFGSVASAADLHVPIPYLTVQSAITAAGTGDTVYLQPGVYKENISLGGKNITIRAFNTNFETILDGNQAGPVVSFSGKETEKCQLRDLIIRNGKSSSGAGISGNATMATLRNCTITGNIATGNGGGVSGLSGSMKNCIITLNQAANGGGIAECEGLIENCLITLNKATATGGGVYNCSGAVQFCQITKNEAATGGGGVSDGTGMLYANTISENAAIATAPASTPASFGGGICEVDGLIYANTITNNLSGGDGGGIAKCNGLIQNNIIATNGSRRGAGIAHCTGRVENNTIWGNRAATVGGGAYGMGAGVANCIIFDNDAPLDMQWSGANIPTYSCVQGWTGGQADIITFSPMLQDPGRGKFNLLPDSPCVDAGKAIPGLLTDFDGDVRPFNGSAIPRGDLSDFDIGADEFVPANIDVVAGFASVTTKYKGAYPKLKTQVQGNLVVVNSGSETITAPFYVQFFISFDPVLDAGDFPVGKITKVGKLAPGKSKKVKCSVKATNIAATGLYLIAVADPAGTIGEPNRANNTAVYGPLP